MHSDQITRYLLGELPESEMLRLGELHANDAQFQQRVKIVEDDLVDCFVKGQLRGEDLMRFRRYFLASAARRERVKLAQGYLDDWEVVQEPELSRSQQAIQQTKARLQAWFWPEHAQKTFERFWETVGTPVKIGTNAAMLFALAICAFLLFDFLRLQYNLRQQRHELAHAQEQAEKLDQELRESQRVTESANTRIKQLREQLAQPSDLQNALANVANNALAALPVTAQAASLPVPVPSATQPASGLPVLNIPAGQEEVVFHLDLTRDTSASYRAELRLPNNGSKLWESGTLKAREKDAGRIVEVKIPANLLSPRAYVLKVIGFNGITVTPYALNYSFRVN